MDPLGQIPTRSRRTPTPRIGSSSREERVMSSLMTRSFSSAEQYRSICRIGHLPRNERARLIATPQAFLFESDRARLQVVLPARVHNFFGNPADDRRSVEAEPRRLTI